VESLEKGVARVKTVEATGKRLPLCLPKADDIFYRKTAADKAEEDAASIAAPLRKPR